MKKFLLGGLFFCLINYCIGATYIIAKGVDRNVRTNRTNASTTD